MKAINLSRGMVAFVDDDDFNLIRGHSWYAQKGIKNKNYYAACRVSEDGKRKMVYMHRVIMQARHGEIVDHKNGNSLYNQRENLRIGNQSLNLRNSSYSSGISKFRGVSYSYPNMKWVAVYRNKRIGTFENEIDAALAYNAVAYEDSPDWSFINKIPGISKDELIKFPSNHIFHIKRSIYRGVYRKSENLWLAHIQYKGGREIIGYYPSEVIAARAYNYRCDDLACPARKNKISSHEQMDLFLSE